jgi:hypothetical protein
MVRSTFSQAAAPPKMSSTAFGLMEMVRLVEMGVYGEFDQLISRLIVQLKGQVEQTKVEWGTSEESVGRRICSRVPSNGQNHIAYRYVCNINDGEA